MIIGVEGLSASGKTTFINKFLEKYPNAIRFRGAGAVNVGIQSRWQEYNFWMHNIIEQLDKLNNGKQLILWDRFLTDAVHSEDGIYASEILRAMKSHSKKCVIYIDVPKDVLISRGSKEGNELEAHSARYNEVIKSFNTLTIKPPAIDSHYITDQHIDLAYEFIQSQLKK
jgi:thymidylate kinase